MLSQRGLSDYKCDPLFGRVFRLSGGCGVWVLGWGGSGESVQALVGRNGIALAQLNWHGDGHLRQTSVGRQLCDWQPETRWKLGIFEIGPRPGLQTTQSCPTHQPCYTPGLQAAPSNPSAPNATHCHLYSACDASVLQGPRCPRPPSLRLVLIRTHPLARHLTPHRPFPCMPMLPYPYRGAVQNCGGMYAGHSGPACLRRAVLSFLNTPTAA